MNIEALAQHLAIDACWEAEMLGKEFDAGNPEDVAHFYPRALSRATEYAMILEGK